MIAVPPESGLVVTEGKYLLLGSGTWSAVRDQLDTVWHVRTEDPLRQERLVARHVVSGKSPAAARAWVARVDEPNAALVEESAHRADLVLDLTVWDGAPRRTPPA